MQRAELINTVSQSANMTKAETERAVRAFEQAVTEALTRGDDITLLGFGKFSVIKRTARKCRNSQTGEIMKSSTRKAVKFKVGKRLAEAVK